MRQTAYIFAATFFLFIATCLKQSDSTKQVAAKASVGY